VRAASGIAPLADGSGDGWLVVSDDATHAAWVRGPAVHRVRVLPPVEGLDVFSEEEGTKHLKPDLEAACAMPDGSVLLLGSGSLPNRMRGAVVRAHGSAVESSVHDLSPLYEHAARALDLAIEDVNLEGACLVGGVLRWFQRGHGQRVPSGSVDVDLAGLLALLEHRAGADDVRVGNPRCHDLGEVDGVALTITDAVALPDGRVLVSAAAEDTPDAVADGPVVGVAVGVIDDSEVRAVLPLIAATHRAPPKIEGLALAAIEGHRIALHAVVDADDPARASALLTLRSDLRGPIATRHPPSGSAMTGDSARHPQGSV
jgi:hypothetical protein